MEIGLQDTGHCSTKISVFFQLTETKTEIVISEK